MRSDKLINHNLSRVLENSLCPLSFIFNSNIEYELVDKIYSERIALLILQWDSFQMHWSAFKANNSENHFYFFLMI